MIFGMTSCRTIEVIGEIIKVAGQMADKNDTGTDTESQTEPSAPGETSEPITSETKTETTKAPEKTTA